MLLLPSVVHAQEEYYAYSSSYYYDDYDYSDYDLSDEDTAAAIVGGAFGFLFLGIGLVITLVVGLGSYIYLSLTLMTIGKKLEYENSWFAWIPILNAVMLFQLGDQNPWLLLLVLIPGLGGLALAIISVIAIMKICEKRGYDKLLGLLTLIPLANYVLFGILAWKDKQ